MASTTGLLLGIGVGLLVADGRVWPMVAIPLLALALWGVVQWLVPQEERRRVGAIIALGFALHVAVAVVLFTGALAVGLGGFIPGDDAEYYFLSRTFVAYLHGQPDPVSVPPYWGGEAYLFGTWVYLESAIFFVIGPEVLVPILLNGAFALVMSLLVYDLARRLFDARAALIALVLTAFFPSLVLWSSLNLKDALALLLIALCLWALVRFQERPRWSALAVVFAALVPIGGLRDYIFVGLALLTPLVVAVTPRQALAARARWTGTAIIASALLLSLDSSGIAPGPQLLETFEGVRHAMALGARTAYVEPPPVVVVEGDTFVVPTVAPSSSAVAEAPAPSPSVIHVAPNTRIVVVTEPAEMSPYPSTIAVRPGDVIVVGTPERTPAPTAARRDLPVARGPADAASLIAILTSGAPSPDTLVRRTFQDLPVGIAFALFGPFPWLYERQLDLLLLPETVLWYACLAAFSLSAMRQRSRWRVLAPFFLFVIGVLGLFSVVEGNWGTLFRHRAMVIPWVVTLAAPSIRLASLTWMRRQ